MCCVVLLVSVLVVCHATCCTQEEVLLEDLAKQEEEHRRHLNLLFEVSEVMLIECNSMRLKACKLQRAQTVYDICCTKACNSIARCYMRWGPWHLIKHATHLANCVLQYAL